MTKLLFLLLFTPFLCLSQEPTFQEGIPDDLDQEKIIFLQHEPVEVTAREKSKKAEKYLYERQTNHNRVIIESNIKLKGAALKYPYEYGITGPSTYSKLAEAGYKYVLQSSVYKYDYLKGQPAENEMIVYEYFIYDMENNVAYEVFKIDEMKVYDFKLIIRKLNKAIKRAQ
jgi:hypothetical protein